MKRFPEAHILTLSGSPRQRGRAHGEALRLQIRELLGRWKERLAQLTAVQPETYIHELVTQTQFQAAIEQWTPGLLDEVEGMAEGAGVDFEELYGFQLQDEEWWFGEERRKAQPAASGNCSAVGWKNSQGAPALVAQNMDLPDFLDGFQVVLRITDAQTGVESLVFSVAGLIALNGLNNHSIGIVCNNLGMLNHSRCGLPVAFVLRGVLEKHSFVGAQAFLHSVHHASGQNYILGNRTGLVDLECSANRVVVYTPPGRTRSVCHTNHPFVNDDYQDPCAAERKHGDPLTPLAQGHNQDSLLRFDAISRDSWVVEQEEAGPETARRLLQSHQSPTNPVCRHPRPGLPWMTVGTSIMALGANPELHVCPGPPCSAEFERFGF